MFPRASNKLGKWVSDSDSVRDFLAWASSEMEAADETKFGTLHYVQAFDREYLK